MIVKLFVIILITEVVICGKPSRTDAGKRQIFPFHFPGVDSKLRFADFDPTINENTNGIKRNKRLFSSAITLLWPQVFGPVDQGVIEEKTYKEIPKTLLEYRLDMIKKKAQEEEETRLIIRDYMKTLTQAQDKFYGYPNKGEPGYMEINNMM